MLPMKNYEELLIIVLALVGMLAILDHCTPSDAMNRDDYSIADDQY